MKTTCGLGMGPRLRVCVVCGNSLAEAGSNVAVTCSKLCRDENTRVHNRRRYAESPDVRERIRINYEKNKDKSNAARRKKRLEDKGVLDRERRWVAQNNEKIRSQKRRRYKLNPSRVLLANKEWLSRHPEYRERIKELNSSPARVVQRKDYALKRYWENRDESLTASRKAKADLLAATRMFRKLTGERRDDNAGREEQRLYSRKWYAKNKAKISEQRKRQRSDSIRERERRHDQERYSILRTFKSMNLI